MALTDDHRYPFSLLGAAKFNPGSECRVERTGLVTEALDKDIGRSTLKIAGTVSANNYVEFDNLRLVGKFMFIQMRLLKSKIATIHLEVVTTSDLSIRISISTLYCNEVPRFLGRSLRLALPKEDDWMILVVDVDAMLTKYCSQEKLVHRFSHVKKIQLCSSMLLRDVVTNDTCYTSTNLLPKELAIKIDSRRKLRMPLIDVVNVSDGLMPGLEMCKAVIPIASPSTNNPADSPIRTASVENLLLQRQFAKSPRGGKFALDPEYLMDDINEAREAGIQGGPEPPIRKVATASKSGVRSTSRSRVMVNHAGAAIVAADKRSMSASRGVASSQSGPLITRQGVPDTAANMKVLSLQRLLHYSGASSVLLYDGKMIVQASGRIIVLIDVEGKAESELANARVGFSGLWRAFAAHANASIKDDIGEVSVSMSQAGYRQAFLKGHSRPIGILEASSNGMFLASVETGPGAQLILWNIQEGKRVATAVPHAEGVSCVAFNQDATLLVTVGYDAQHRVQIIVWDVQLLLIDRLGNSAVPTHVGQQAVGLVVAKQLSDFAVSKISFSPFEESTLVSCGRENIRFWRIRKGHLPGRPVLLNEYSRGFSFSEIAFDTDAGAHPTDPRKPMAYVSSNKGMLIKIDCVREQVLCAYQLHNGAITAFALRSGYAVTGGTDNRLRVWPMDFADFQLEAHHEGAITNISATKDGHRLLVGTSAGTLGVLDIAEHSYNTVLRSHHGTVLEVVARGNGCDEFVSLGTDRSIRLWDVITGQQRFEFTSAQDQPRSAAFDPRGLHLLVCGFESGYMRVFDVDSTSTVVERHSHTAPVTTVVYSYRHTANQSKSEPSVWSEQLGGAVLLFSAGLDGLIVSYDAENQFLPLRSVSVSSRPIPVIHLSVNAPGTLLAAAIDTVGTVTVYATDDLASVYRGGHLSTTTQQIGLLRSDGAGDNVTLAKSHDDGNFGSVQTPLKSPSAHLFDDSNVMSAPGSGKTPLHATPGVTPVSTPLDNFGATTGTLAAGTTSSGSSSTAPVAGIAFTQRPDDTSALLILTDKHLVSLHLEAEWHRPSDDDPSLTPLNPNETPNSRLRKKRRSVWESRIVKRFAFGTPRALRLDPHTGLLFVILKSPVSIPVSTASHNQQVLSTLQSLSAPFTSIHNFDSSSGGLATATGRSQTIPALCSHDGVSSSTLEEAPDAFMIVSVKHKGHNPSTRVGMGVGLGQERLSFSKAQLYREHAGSVSTICVCGPCGRVVTADGTGCLSIWRVNDENLQALLHDDSQSPPVNSNSPNTSGRVPITPNSVNSTPRVPISGTSYNAHSSTQSILDSTGKVAKLNYSGVENVILSPKQDSVVSSRQGGSSNEDLVHQTEGLTAQFAEAVMANPAAWSAVSDSSSRKLQHFGAQGDVEIALSDVAVNLNVSHTDRDTFLGQSVDAKTPPRSVGKAWVESAEGPNSPSRNAGALLKADDIIVESLDGVSVSNFVASSFTARETDIGAHNDLSREHSPEPREHCELKQEMTLPAEEPLFTALSYDQQMILANTTSSANVCSLSAIASVRHPVVPDQSPSTLLKNLPSFSLTVLGVANSVKPSICHARKFALVSDGSLIALKSVNGNGLCDSFLKSPWPCATDVPYGAVVEAVSCSPSGLFAVAVLRQPIIESSQETEFSTNPNNFRREKKSLFVWFQDIATGSWRLLSGAGLPILPALPGTAMNVTIGIDWAAMDCLVLAIPCWKSATIPGRGLHSTKSATSIVNDDISLVVVQAGELLKGNLAQSLAERGLGVVTGERSLLGLRVIQDLSALGLSDHQAAFAAAVDQREQLNVLVWTHSKVLLMHVQSGTKASVRIVWTDEIGTKGPFVSLDVAAVVRDVPRSGVNNGPQIHPGQYSVFAALDSFGGVRIGLLNSVAISGLAISTSSATKISSGVGKKLGSSRSVESDRSMSKAVDARIAAAHVFGALRNVAISTRTVSSYESGVDSCQIVNSYIVLASQNTLRVFSLTLRNAFGKQLSANLSVIHKVSLGIVPEYVSFLLNEHLPGGSSKQVGEMNGGIHKKGTILAVPDILVATTAGDFGLVKSSYVSANHEADVIKDLHSYTSLSSGPISGQKSPIVAGGLHSSVKSNLANGKIDQTTVIASRGDANFVGKDHGFVGAGNGTQLLAACPLADVVCLVVNGVPRFYNSISGLQMEFVCPYPNVTAIDSSSSAFALGFACGRVAVYEAKTLALLFISVVSTAGPGHSKFSGLDGKPEYQPAVRALLLLNNGSCVVSLHEDGQINVVASILAPVKMDSPASCVTKVPLRNIETSPSKSQLPIRIVKCSGDDCMFGVVRFGSVIEIFRVVYQSPPGLPAAGLKDATSATISTVLFGLIRNFAPKYGQEIEVLSARLVRNGSWLVLSTVAIASAAPTVGGGGASAESSMFVVSAASTKSCHLFVGAVNMLTAPSKAANTSLVGKMPHLAVYEKLEVSPSVDRLHELSVSFAGDYCVVTTPLGLFLLNILSAAVANTLSDSYAVVENVIRSYAISIGSENSWANATVSISSSSAVIKQPSSETIVQSSTTAGSEFDEPSSYFPNSSQSASHSQSSSILQKIESSNSAPPIEYNIVVHKADKPALFRFTFFG